MVPRRILKTCDKYTRYMNRTYVYETIKTNKVCCSQCMIVDGFHILGQKKTRYLYVYVYVYVDVAVDVDVNVNVYVCCVMLCYVMYMYIRVYIYMFFKRPSHDMLWPIKKKWECMMLHDDFQETMGWVYMHLPVANAEAPPSIWLVEAIKVKRCINKAWESTNLKYPL